MRTHKFDMVLHKPMLEEWLSLRELTVPHEDLFSDIGYVVEDKAIGFLFVTNSRQGYIDHIVADPRITGEDRKQALDELFRILEEEAAVRGCLMVTALAVLPAMRSRFERQGYSHYGEFGLYYKVLRS